MFSIALILLGEILFADLQNNDIERICKFCGEVVNNYCCQYHNNCCDYINPSGCPTPSSPEARASCKNPVRCLSNSDCPVTKQCCRTTLCGATCMESIFTGYKY